ncbi:putative capsid [uncultured virus]|uniref:Putative capsid n=1 Tax=uncultured virus TaxID=340016 RepID=A0A2K9LT99_9VIRU|nr:putative capsid [uncultured virus]
MVLRRRKVRFGRKMRRSAGRKRKMRVGSGRPYKRRRTSARTKFTAFKRRTAGGGFGTRSKRVTCYYERSGSWMGESGGSTGNLLSLNSVINGDWRMVLNNPYDPEAAVGGPTAANFRPWSLLYNKYRVLKAKVSITFYQRAPCAAGIYPMAAGLKIDDNGSWTAAAGSNWWSLQRDPTFVFKKMYMGPAGNAKVTVTKTVNMRDWFDPKQDNSASTSANPAHLVYAFPCIQNLVCMVDPTLQAFYMTIRVSMDTLFTEPKDMTEFATAAPAANPMQS